MNSSEHSRNNEIEDTNPNNSAIEPPSPFLAQHHTKFSIEDHWNVKEMKLFPFWSLKKYFALSSIFSLLLLALFLILYFNQKGKLEPVKVVHVNSRTSFSPFNAERAKAKIFVLLNEYLQANTTENKSKHIRHKNFIKPHIEKYYFTNKLKKQLLKEITHIQQIKYHRLPFISVKALLADNTQKTFQLLRVAENDYEIDWEMDVLYQKNSWSKFLNERPTEAKRFRVALHKKEHPFYAYNFTEADYLAFEIELPNEESKIWGYVNKQNIALINRINSYLRSSKANFCQVEIILKYPLNASSSVCTQIMGISNSSWISMPIRD